MAPPLVLEPALTERGSDALDNAVAMPNEAQDHPANSLFSMAYKCTGEPCLGGSALLAEDNQKWLISTTRKD
jgi:hypothetical protein